MRSSKPGWAHPRARKEGFLWHFDSEFSEIVERTPSVKSFRFPRRIKSAPYKPGQFFFLTIKIKGEDALHHFSFSSSPSDEGYIEFTKRITAHDYSQALNAMQPGSWAHLQGPEGDFLLPPLGRQLAFLTGGIGITPVRSMLRYIAYHKLNYNVVLLYGNSSFEEIVFREELTGLAAAHTSIRVEHLLSGPSLPSDWKGRKGLIDKAAVIELVPDYKERLFYVSGPPTMVMTIVEQLGALRIPQQQIRRDSFTGYD